MNNSKAFNLLYSPWLLTTDFQGHTAELNLLELFEKAHELKSLSGESVVQDAAVLRLLLGVLYSVFTRVDIDGAALDDEYDGLEQWETLWNNGKFPREVIARQLEKHKERFWLIHPAEPFWQVVFDKPPVNGNGIEYRPYDKPMKMFIASVGSSDNKENVFCGRADVGKAAFAEAARWLVYMNAFDVSVSGNPGKNPKAMTGYGHPWPANIGVTWIAGDNLFQTLMLNMVLEYNGENWEDSKAWWEAPFPCKTAADLERVELPLPESITELMSRQYRYIRLVAEGEVVTGYELWGGTRFNGDGAFVEQMTPWKISEDRKTKKQICSPHRHDSSKQMWRDLSAFTARRDDNAVKCPGIVSWADALQRKANIQIPIIRICSAGVTYKKDTAIENLFFDSLSLNAALLSDLGDAWFVRTKKVLETTEEMVKFLGFLAADIAKASRKFDETRKEEIEKLRKIRETAQESAYYRLDALFRDWLVKIDPRKSVDMDDYCNKWYKTARRVLLDIGSELVEQGGTQAFIGINDDSSPKAFRKFKINISNKLKKEGIQWKHTT
jgi:CRISPR system Cascade subunit CasA